MQVLGLIDIRTQMRSTKTKLLRVLQRAHKLNIIARKRGKPLDEVIDEDNTRRNYTRRRFIGDTLKASAALAIPGVLQACTTSRLPASGQPGLPSIAIAGAGIAGLHAAHILNKSNIRVQVFEASKRPGGRMMSAHNLVAEGTTTELGGEFIDSSHIDILNLCREFDLPLIDTYAESETGLIRDAFFFNGSSYTEEDVIHAFSPYSNRIQNDIDSLPDEISYRSVEPVSADMMSVAEYLQSMGMEGWLYKLFEAAYIGEYGLELERQSALNFLYLFDPDVSEGFHVFGDSDERYKIKGGNDQLPAKLAAAMQDQISYEYQLESISGHGNKYKLSFSNGKEVTADFVVLALPFTILRNMKMDIGLSPVKKKCIQELGYGTNSKLFAGYTERSWRSQGFQGFVFSDAFQNGWESSQLQNNNQGPASYTFFMGGAKGESLKKQDYPAFVEHLNKVFPDSAGKYNGRHAAFNWPSFPLVKASYTCYMPGQYTSIGGAEAEPAGNVFFAGEHCSFEFQGFMNGAAETGRQAAEMILSRLD